MKPYRYILEPYKGASTRFVCPNCNNRQRTFTRYIDLETTHYLNDNVGKCNREDNCGYHYKPKEYFNDFGITTDHSTFVTKRTIEPAKPISYIEEELVVRSFNRYDANNFLKFIEGRFGQEIATHKCNEYLIGTSKHWKGASIFWQKDLTMRYRTGKIMLYDPVTCKRVSGKYGALINWAHVVVNNPDFNLQQCLFGEHLLANNIKPIAIVESEKNAILASIYYPQFTWLATGSKGNLTAQRCKNLRGQKVILFPDYGAYVDWKRKADQLGFEIDNFIEEYALENNEKMGFDIADYLLGLPPPLK